MTEPRRFGRVIPIRALIPNAVTVLALCCGLTGVRFGIAGEWEKAVASIVIAGVLDGIDGRIARLLKGADGPVYAATSAYHMPRCVLLLGIAGLDAHRSQASIGPASSRILRCWWWALRELPAIPIDCLILGWMKFRKRI